MSPATVERATGGTAGSSPAARTLAVEAGSAERRRVFSLELDRGRTYRFLASETVRNALIDQLSRTGCAALVPAEGGLIGNLKIWENIALPLAWQGKEGSVIEARARAILEEFGIAGEGFVQLCRSLPEHLSNFERRIVAFVRVMLIEPEIMVYDRLFEGLTQTQTERARLFDRLFHHRFPFRTSVYLESDAVATLVAPVHAEHDLR